jgi:hypothetical protein
MSIEWLSIAYSMATELLLLITFDLLIASSNDPYYHKFMLACRDCICKI